MPVRRSYDDEARGQTRYAGARLRAHPGGASAAPQAARVGAFVQGLLSARGSCARAGDVARLFRDIEGGNSNSAAPLSAAEEAALSRLVADANAALEPMHLAVKRVTLPEPVVRATGAAANRGGGGRATNNGGGETENASPHFDAAASIAGSHSRSYYGVVNVEPDPVALANGWGLSPALLAYLRAVLERMVKSSDTPCGSVAQETLLSIDHAADAVAADNAAAQRAAAAALRGNGGGNSDTEDDDGGGDEDARAGSPGAAAEARRQRASAAAAAARANATKPPPPLKKSERGAALQALADSGWLLRLTALGGGGGAARGGGGNSNRRSSLFRASISYGIGPCSFMELGDLLRSFDPAPEVLAAWAAQL